MLYLPFFLFVDEFVEQVLKVTLFLGASCSQIYHCGHEVAIKVLTIKDPNRIWYFQLLRCFKKKNYVSDCSASANDDGCCTDSFPCANGEGDCDSDSECAGNLVCGEDNCIHIDSDWSDSLFDCCTKGKNIVIHTTVI